MLTKTFKPYQLRSSVMTLFGFGTVAILLTFFVLPGQITAETMSGETHIIQGKTEALTEITPPEKKQPYRSYFEGHTPTTGKNYSVSVLADENGLAPVIGFSLSEEILSYGVLSATNPVTRTNDLQIYTATDGYTVLAREDHALRSKNKAIIPDTTCDNGACTENIAAPWVNTLTYGFGYRCEKRSGQGECSEGFEAPNTYKAFGSAENNEQYYPILNSIKKDKDDHFRFIYKINISGTQPEDAYVNNLTYVIVPNF